VVDGLLARYAPTGVKQNKAVRDVREAVASMERVLLARRQAGESSSQDEGNGEDQGSGDEEGDGENEVIDESSGIVAPTSLLDSADKKALRERLSEMEKRYAAQLAASERSKALNTRGETTGKKMSLATPFATQEPVRRSLRTSIEEPLFIPDDSDEAREDLPTLPRGSKWKGKGKADSGSEATAKVEKVSRSSRADKGVSLPGRETVRKSYFFQLVTELIVS
jgi:hypothetical protein